MSRSFVLCEQRSASAELATVDGDGGGVADDEDADEPGEGDPMSLPTGCWANRARMVSTIEVTGWFSANQATGAWHRVGGHERRADERQEDQRVAECARAVDGLDATIAAAGNAPAPLRKAKDHRPVLDGSLGGAMMRRRR
ncbi:MAG TPA: hypothetical protein VHJ18_11765 [Streptosporangiaceae bacterium]|nr:hypothetical protein [Streptosporangiaceae bacterium]